MPKIYLFLLMIFFSAISAAAQSSFGSGAFRNPFDDLYTGSPLLEFRADILDNNRPPNTRDTMIIDFASRQITFARVDKLTGMSLWEFHYAEMSDFLRDMEIHTIQTLWNEIAREQGRAPRGNRHQHSGLTFAMPAHLPRWATRILGQEPPKLAITGTQRLTFGVKRQMSGGTPRAPAFKTVDPIFQPHSNFNIRGSVGRLLHLEINLRGDVGDDDFFQQARDQLSQIRIHYREEIPGELEDDIIQEVEIGKTSFQMPGQGLAGFSSGSNDNLFGVRVRSRFGPLELTTIASIENVELQRRTIDMNATRTDSISELNYVRNKFFYIDTSFKSLAEGRIQTPRHRVEASRIEVYRKVFNSNEPNILHARYHGGGDQIHTFLRLSEGTEYEIDQLRTGVIRFTPPLRDSDVIGIVIRDMDGLTKGDLTMVPEKLPNRDTIVDVMKSLWILKDNQSVPGDSLYDLMLRNVYNIGITDEVGLELSVLRVSDDGRTQAQNDEGKHFVDILGLADDQVLRRANTRIFDLDNGFMFIPPIPYDIADRDGLNANWVFTNPLLGTVGGINNQNFNAYIDTVSEQQEFFRIRTRSRRRTESFNLDFGIVEGSERLWTQAGDTLVRNQDYTIDYGFGRVQLLSHRALSANVIEASYQKESLFLLDRKVFVGLNAKLDLPGIGRNSFLSTTAMWQFMNAKKMMPKVGTEPFNRFLFASNLRLDFVPLWMTSAINYIPLIEREASSAAVFDFEVAHSSVQNSARSGGEAYIDNFSTSSRNFSLGTSHTVWHRAAPDRGRLTGDENNSFIKDAAHFARNIPAWHHYWFQPLPGDDRPLRREIYPVLSAADRNQHMNTLRLVVQPLPPEDSGLRAGITNAEGNIIVSPWAGISHGLSPSLRNRSDDRFFEFWIKPGTAGGTLTIDFGEVEENQSLDGGLPSGNPNFESDISPVSEAADIGLNRLTDEREYWLYPRFAADGTFQWDTLKHGDRSLGIWENDPARDNWRLYGRDSLTNRIHANGTQGNRSVNPRPDTEDIDGDGRITMTRFARFFRFEIDLATLTNPDSPFHNSSQQANEAGSGWIHVRIPVGFAPGSPPSDFADERIHRMIRSEGNQLPSWQNIHHVRMIWSGMETSRDSVSLEFEGIQFVGNSWREQRVKDTITGTVIASILDSRTFPGYEAPRRKRLDSLSGQEATDYTLRIEFENSPANRRTIDGMPAPILVSRRFEQQQAMNLTNYRAIKFWATDALVDDPNNLIDELRDNWLVVRFGSNDSTFYEFRTRRIRQMGDNGPPNQTFGWANEGFTIDLDTLTKLKLDWFNRHSERHGSINTEIQTRDGDFLRVYSRTQMAPTLSNISWIAFGVQSPNNNFTSDVRINGFRATGISDYNGWAMRASMRLNWSDFIENTFNFRYTDADFRSMSDNVLRESSAQVSSGVSSTVHLDRFLPDRLGVQLPLRGEIVASLHRPEMRPHSDISLTDEQGNPDGLRDMAGDFGRFVVGADETDNFTESQKYERRGRTRSASTSYRKNRTSEAVVPRLTADRISVDYRISQRDSMARMGEIPQSEMGLRDDGRPFINREGFERFHGEITTHQQHAANLGYDFSPSRNVMQILSWSPFVNSTSTTLSRRIRTMSFNLLPERVVFGIANVDYSRREFYSSIQDAIDTTGLYFYNQRPFEEVRIAHQFNMTHRPINPFITINYRLDVDRNFDYYIRHWDGRGVSEFANTAVFRLDDEFGSYNVLFSEQRRVQDLRISFTPEITRWLTVSSDMGGGYTQNIDLQDSSVYMRTAITSTFSVSPALNLRRLFEDFSRRANNERFSGGLGTVARGFERVGFENINLRYNAEMRLRNSFMDLYYLDGGLDRANTRYMLYSFGVFDRSFGDFVTGNMNDSIAFGGVQNRNDRSFDEYGNPVNLPHAADRRNTSQSVTGSTSLRFPRPVDISVNTISLGWTRTYSITHDVDRIDTAITFPDVRLGASSSALEQLEVVRSNFSTFRLDWGYTYRQIYAREGRPSERIENSYTIDWGLTPLIRTNMRLRRIGLDLSHALNLRYAITEKYDSTRIRDTDVWEVDSIKRKTNRRTIGNDWTAGYHIPGRRGRTIRLFRDQVVDINGDIDISLTVGYIKTYHEFTPSKSLLGESLNFEENSFSLRPQAAYRFTRNIDAVLSYNLTHSISGRDQHFTRNGTVKLEITISF